MNEISKIRVKTGPHKILNRFTGWYLSDIDCKYCPEVLHRKGGRCKISKAYLKSTYCPHLTCLFETEKQDAIKNNRIKRPAIPTDVFTNA